MSTIVTSLRVRAFVSSPPAVQVDRTTATKIAMFGLIPPVFLSHLSLPPGDKTMSMFSMFSAVFGRRGDTARRPRRRKLGLERLDRRAMLTASVGPGPGTCYFFDLDPDAGYDDGVADVAPPTTPPPSPTPAPLPIPEGLPPKTISPTRELQLRGEPYSDRPDLIGC
ncbi:MAG: hypothetical protein ACKOT0_11460 [bacterium]